MSIRRKSCEPCYRARRKCSLHYPVCARCSKGGKSCHYRYPPQLDLLSPTDDDETVAVVAPSASAAAVSTYARIRNTQGTTIPPSVLLVPLHDCANDWTWVLDQIRDLPHAFARHAETVFIHRALYGEDGTLPRPLRAAFGICAASATLNDRTRPVFFRALDDEVSGLLRVPPAASDPGHTLLEDLVRLQVAVLCQTIRLFQGGAEQRVVAERQEFLVRSHGLTLLTRADAELHAHGPDQSWETWLLGESIRRTVLVAFKLYSIYSSFRYGVCAEADALDMLPVSSAQPGSWVSREAYYLPQKRFSSGRIVTCEEFSQQWEAQPRSNVDEFEKLVLVGCMGLSRFEAMIEGGGH